MRTALRSFAALGLAVAVVTCVDSPVGPARGTGSAPGRASVAFAPRFSSGAAQAAVLYDLNGLLVDQVHVVVTLNGQSLADTTVAYSATDSSFSLALNVAADPGDQVAFSLQYLSGTTVLYSGSGTATTFAVGSPPPANPSPVVVVPVGPGAAAARVVVTPASGSFSTATATIPFAATVTDANNATIAGALLSWTTSDPSIATIGATTGLLQPTGKRGSVTVSASTLNGVTGTAVIALVPPPAKLVVVSGGGQSSAAGSALAQPVVVQLQATDGLGASGQAVAFSLSGGAGASVNPATAITDANGNAQTTLTLGTAVGTYTLTATSAAFSAPATETATAAAVATLTLVSGSGQTDSVKQQVPLPLVVKAADQFGNPKSGVVVTWTRTAGAGTPSASSTTTASDGTTSIAYTFGSALGTETVAASTAGVSTPVTFTETATTGGAATITAVTGSGQLAAIGVALPVPLVARVVDATGNPVTGAHVAWTIAGGTLATSQSATDATGQATATVVTGQTAGPLVVTATLVSGASVQFSETVTSGAAAGVRFTVNPSTVAGSTVMTPAVQVTVTDASGNPITFTSASVTLTLTGGTVGAVLSGTLTQKTVDGVATFPDLSVNLTGTGYAFVATVSGLPPAPSATFTVSTGSATKMVLVGQSSYSVVAGSSPSATGGIQVTDANGIGVAGVTISVTADSNGVPRGTASIPTDASGFITFAEVAIATSSSLVVETAGVHGVTFTNAALQGSPIRIVITATPGPASQIQFLSAIPQSTAGVTLAPIMVGVTDQFGNAVSSATGSVTISVGAGPGPLSGTLTQPLVSGVATFANLVLNKSTTGAGVYALTATSGTFSPTSSNTFGVNAGPSVSLSIGTVPATVAAGSSIGNGSGVRVTVVDAEGNQTTAAVSVSMAITGGTGGAVLSGSGNPPTLQTVNGGVTFSILSINLAGTGYQLVASSAGLTSATSPSFTVTGGTATQIALNAGNNQSASGGTSVATPPSVAVKDVNGNPVSGVTVTFAVASGGGSITGPTPTTNASGIATVGSWTLGSVAGANTLTATAGSLAGSPVTFTATGTGTTSIQWTNAAGGSWSVPGNWNLGRVPTSTDSVVIALAGTYSITLDTTFTGAYISVGGAGSGTQTVTLSSRTLTLTGQLIVKSGGAFTPTSSAVTGSGSMLNQGTVTLVGTTVNVPLDNQGTLALQGSVVLNGAVTAELSSTMLVEGNGGCCPASAIVANGFTNNGTLSLTTTNGSNGGDNAASLTVTAGTLVNASPGTINVLLGTSSAGPGRTLTGQLNNQGTITVSTPLAWNAANASTNSGTITINAGLTVTMVGGSPTLTNAGTMTVASGQTLAINFGTFTEQIGATLNGGTTGGLSFINSTAGTLNTGVTLETLSLNNSTASLGTSVALSGLTVSNGSTVSLAGGLSTATTPLSVSNSTVNGPGTITNGSAQTTTFVQSTINAPVDNQGTLALQGGITLNGAVTAEVGSTMLVEGNGGCCASIVTMANGFTNNGTLTLTTVNGSNGGDNNATLTVTTGTLVNASTGTINVLQGTSGPGPLRTLNAQLNNQGTIAVSTSLAWNAVSATSTNSGTITANAGLTLTQSGTTPSFTNSGTITNPQGLTITGGTFTEQNGATLNVGLGGLTLVGVTAGTLNAGLTIGPLQMNNSTASLGASIALGTLSLTNNSTVSLASGISTATTVFSVSNSTVNGPGTITNSSGTGFSNATINAPVDNQGLLGLQGNVALNGALTAEVGSTMMVDGNGGCCASNVTVASGFTNNGTLTLTTVNGSNGGDNAATVTVTAGTLVNASTGTINVLQGTSATAPTRTLTAQLNNQGVITISTPLAWNAVSATSTNSGTITLNAGLTLTQSGTTPSFTNTGTMTAASGQTLAISGGTFTEQNGATLSAAGGSLTLTNVTAGTLNTGVTLGPLTLTTSTASLGTSIAFTSLTLNASSTVSLASGISTATTPFSTSNSTVNGPGTIANGSGQTTTFYQSTINAPVDNQGTLALQGSVALNGALTAELSSTILVEGNGGCCASNVTVANGFTNNGTLTLTTFNGSNGGDNAATLTVATGTLLNASTGTINVLLGTSSAGPTRTLTAQLNNQGVITVSTPLAWNGVSATSTNSGTITLNAGLTLAQSGTTPSFTNTGTLTVASGQTLAISGGTFTEQNGATLSAGGANVSLTSVAAGTLNAGVTLGPLTLTSSTAILGTSLVFSALTVNTSATVSLAGGLSTATTPLSVNNATVNGPGTITNGSGQTTTLIGATINAPFDNQGTLALQGSVALNGAVTAELSSTMLVEGNGGCCAASVTVANGFTNNGTLELTTVNGSNGGDDAATLTVTSGVLTNASTGTISVLTGTSTGTPTRTITAPLVDNQGLLNVFPLTAGTFAINGDLTEEVLSTLQLSLGGTTSGSTYDLVQVSGYFTIQVGAALVVNTANGFTPVSGNSFIPVTSTLSTSGTFLTATLPGTMTLQYNANNITLIQP